MGVVPTHPLRVAAKAANTDTKTIRRRIDNGAIKLRGNDAKCGGSGNHIGLSRNRILQIAVVEQLTSLGVAVSTAAEAALQFTDVGDWDRPPGQLFPMGRTFLVIPSGAPPVVMRSDLDASIADLSARAVSFVLCDLNAIVADVDSTLHNFEK